MHRSEREYTAQSSLIATKFAESSPCARQINVGSKDMQIKSKSGLKFELPTDEEDLAINAGIAADPDTVDLPDESFASLRRIGRPKLEFTKERITIRLSQEVTEYFRATGKGWQTRAMTFLTHLRGLY